MVSVVAKPFNQHDLSNFGLRFHPINTEQPQHSLLALRRVGKLNFHSQFVELHIALACQGDIKKI